MLEGQVAILSSGALSTNENLEVLNNLRNSKLFRPDQYSYLLYPNKNLPGFLEKNNIPDKDVLGSKFLTSLVEEGNKQIIVKDCHGGYHFNGLFNNINSLVDEIKKLPEKKIIIENSYTIRVIGSNISLERFYNDYSPEGVIEELIEISSPEKDKKTFFIFLLKYFDTFLALIYSSE